MSPEQWNTYCYQYNQLNEIAQPPQLINDIQYYQRENARRRRQAIEAKKLAEYNASWQGKSTKSIWKYFYFMIPTLLILALWEDASSIHSPRRGWWKNKISIPDFNDWLMFEIVNTVNAMVKDREGDAARKDQDKKDSSKNNQTKTNAT